MPHQGVSSAFPGTHKYPSLDPSSFFDWDRWEADQGAHGSSRSESNLSWSGTTDDQDAMSIDGGPQSDSRSIPDLVYGTSGTPSDSGHPGSPGSPTADLNDYTFATHLGHGKHHNDLYPNPSQQELGEHILPYDPEVHVYDPLDPSLGLTHDYRKSSSKKTSRGSASKRPHGATEAVSKKGTQRGRRSGPLCNKDEVAEVRALGACFRCKITKVSCDKQLDCEKCVKHAESRSGCYDSSIPLSQQICIRRSFAQCGRAFEKIQECQPSTAQNKIARDAMHSSPSIVWDVFFTPGGPALPISVVEHVSIQDSAMYPPSAQVEYFLNRREVPGLPQLQAWVSAQMTCEGPLTSFQSSLDILLHSLCRLKPHSTRKPEWKTLLEKVSEMRSMFKIWSTNNFWCVQDVGSVVQELPWSVQAELKRIATSRMRSLELDIIASLDKLLEPKEVKSLTDLQKVTVWVCLMECILLYRELLALPSIDGTGFAQDSYDSHYGRFCRATMGIYTGLVVMCDAYFAKIDKLLEQCSRMEEAAMQDISVDVSIVLQQRTFFYQQSLDLSPDSSDQILFALLVRAKNKRAKHSR
ncbi:hypothetical protein Micbo1qcDRAFT_233318 [Microdochium bolleyi]|uniref:Zn(2)-C6 fungal-type domain-containing protein n=1 Tax=Microdochium bolleyi TaxID=196109 RepID=A0A136J481_9PEZI|nr:hypothetical protein Micbo1qcDRAFT_233318 [Microdochium bolleyi]